MSKITVMLATEVQRIVAEHDAIPKADRIFHDPPKIEIPQHCIECSQDMPPVLVGWDLLEDAAKKLMPLPVIIGTVCADCQKEGA